MNTVDAPPTGTPVRRFARFELRQLLGKSTASNTWLAFDPNVGTEVLLCVPRVQPAAGDALDHWTQEVVAASRLRHPRLPLVLDVGIHEGWPFVVHERGAAVTLSERLQAHGKQPTVLEHVQWVLDVLEALAYAHEAGISHRDIATHNVLIDGNGHTQLAGLAVGLAAPPASGGQVSMPSLQERRAAAERDVLMVGLLLHRLLAGHPALDDPDLGHAAQRVGLEIVRLPWTTPLPVPETLRAIVNRATDRQHRQRYLNARTLLSALQGWVKTNSQESAGPLELFLDRINSVGHLPSRATDVRAIQKLLINDQLRVDDMVDQLIKDPALSWELLRVVNTARYQSGIDDTSCSLSRAVVLLGEQGLRKVSGGLRAWPGVLAVTASTGNKESSDKAITALETAMKRACIAALTARWLRPFNISDEEAMVAAMSQHLGRLLILYHFPEESAQIDSLMQAAPPSEPGGKPTPGMALEAATGAVLGISPVELTDAVLRHWGFPDAVVQAAHPLSLQVSPRKPESADEWLRIIASLSNEVCGLIGQPASRQALLMTQLLSRYGRPALTSQKELVEALQNAIRVVDRGLYRQMFPQPANLGAGSAGASPASPTPPGMPRGSR